MFTIEAEKRVRLKDLKKIEAADVIGDAVKGSRWEPTEHFDVLRAVDKAMRAEGLTPKFETTTEANGKIVAATATFVEAGVQPVLGIVSGLNGRVPIRFYGGVRLPDGTSFLTCPEVPTLKHQTGGEPLTDFAARIAAACRATCTDKTIKQFDLWQQEASEEKFGPIRATPFLDEFVGRAYDQSKISTHMKYEVLARLSEPEGDCSGPPGTLFRFWWAFAFAVSRGRPTYQLGRKLAFLAASKGGPPEVFKF